MQSDGVTSGRRHRMLTRSRSLASPLEDATTTTATTTTLSLSSGSNGAAPPLCVDVLSKPAAEDLQLQASGQSGIAPKKSLRRQKTLAELFGVVFYKSKAQLHELFFRRDRDASRDRARVTSSQPASTKCDLGAGASGGAGGGVGLAGEATAVMGKAAMASLDAAASPRKKIVPQRQRQLASRGPVMLRNSHPDLSTGGTAAGRTRCRTPEELFCVQTCQPPSEAQRPASTRSLDTLHQHSSRQGSPEMEARASDGRLLKPDRGCKTKSTLVKSSSDSLCRLAVQSPQGEGASLTKASSDDMFFVRRKPSPLLPRDRQVAIGDSSSSISSSSSSASPRSRSSVGPSSINPILDWLLVGGVEGYFNDPLLCGLGVGAIVDATNVAPSCVPPEKKTTCPCTCGKKHFRSKLNLAVDDIEWENIEQYFHDVNAFVDGWRRRGSRVLVVSYHGKSRAPALVVQYLMHHFRIPLERALAHVRSRRPQTRINPGFMRSLQRLEKRLADEDSLRNLPPPPSFSDCVRRSPRTAWDEC